MIPLYILAGGESSRFGSDKARALLEGTPLVVRVAEALSPLFGSTTVVAAAADAYNDLGLATIGDDVPGLGPMGGLITALRHCDGALFLASCDLRMPRAEWAEPLAATDTTAAYRTQRGWEPLFARYDRDVLAVAEGLLERGERSLQILLDEVGATALESPGVWPDEPSFNTPEELA